MSANIKLYSNADCSTEVELSGVLYELILGASSGIDCRFTDITVTRDVWIKNVGDVVAMYVNIAKENDPDNRISFQCDSSIASNNLTIGNMIVNEIKKLTIKLILKKGTTSGLYNTSVYLKYQAVP